MEHSTRPASPSAPARRSFFQSVAYALGALAAGLAGVPILGYFFGVRARPEVWVKLDRVEKFAHNVTRRIEFDNPIRQPWDGMCAHTAVYVRRNGPESAGGEEFSIFAVNCAHLGCPVEWFPESGLFMCPCHGGVYYANGERASGPPPRGLFRYEWRIVDGHLAIRAPHYPTLQDTLRSDDRA